MENPRPEKVAVVEEVRDKLTEATGTVVTEYRGLSVAAMSQLRNELRAVGGTYKVYKNTLARRAASEAGIPIGDMLIGPTALAFVEPAEDGQRGDVVSVARVLRDFAKDNPDLIVKGGVLDTDVFDADQMKKLADVEPREVLLAKLAGAMAAPMVQFAGLLQAVPRDFAYGLQALIEKGGASDAPEAAPAAAEPAEADAPAAEATPEAEPAEETTPAAEAGEESES